MLLPPSLPTAATAALLLSAVTSAAPTASSPDATNPTRIACPLIFDGRIPATLSLADFDTSSSGSPFGPDYVKGGGLEWSDILLLPTGLPPSRFDSASNSSSYKPVEVTLSDKSVFQSQHGFRRAGLQFNGDSNTGSPADEGVRTLHFSVRQDAARPLNLSHEYLNVWHEASDYSADQFMFETGTIIGQEGLPRSTFKVLSRQSRQLWSTPIVQGDWQNFAFTLDFGKNTIQVYYSKGDEPLQAVTKAVADDLSGGGQYQIGMLKKPTGTSDVVNAGYQESGIHEGQIYGGIFIEDSTGGCVSL